MCGLIFVSRTDGKSAKRIVNKRYQKQKIRGTLGFGFISAENFIVKSWQRDTEEKGILDKLEKDMGSLILFHHRHPTSTPNLIEATHPIVVSHPSLKYDYYFIHNGIITNSDELKEKHEALGFKYTTIVETWLHTRGDNYIVSSEYNDSEALAIDLALNIEGLKTSMETFGSIAFVGLQVDKVSAEISNVYYGRNYSNPLMLNQIGEILVIASEGSGKEIDPQILFRYDPKTKTHHKEDKVFGYRKITPVKYDKDDSWGFRSRTINDYDDYPPTDRLFELPARRDIKDISKDISWEEEDKAIEDVSFAEDPEGALIQLYEDLAKFEDYKKIAENANREPGIKVWELRIARTRERIEEIDKFLKELETEAAVEETKEVF